MPPHSVSGERDLKLRVAIIHHVGRVIISVVMRNEGQAVPGQLGLSEVREWEPSSGFLRFYACTRTYFKDKTYYPGLHKKRFSGVIWLPIFKDHLRSVVGDILARSLAVVFVVVGMLRGVSNTLKGGNSTRKQTNSAKY